PRRRHRRRAHSLGAARRTDHRGQRGLPHRAGAVMTSVWIVVALTGVATVVLKGAGPAVLGGRALPDRLLRPMALLAPALLAALVATNVLAGDRGIVLDARSLGIGAAGIAV